MSDTTVVEFYKNGFFGYASEVDFHMFSVWHFLPIILMILAIILIYKYRDKIRNYKYEETIRYVVAFIMMIVEMSYFWRLLYVGSQGSESNMFGYFPLQMCQWGLIICIFTLISKNEKLFAVNFYITLLFAPIAFIYPMVITYTGPGYYRYYQFWLEHILPFVSVFYLMFVHGLKPDYNGIFRTWFLLIPLTVVSVIANSMIPSANYLYLKTNLPILPDEQLFEVPILFTLVFIIFNIMHLLFYKIDNRKKKVYN